jgi:hypothetical protein
MWLFMKCAAGTPAFIGWFILYYCGEMVLTWLTIVPSHPEWAVPAARILLVPAAALAFRKAMQSAGKWERGFWR